MLEKPNLTDAQFIACLKQDYGLDIAEFMYLPLGANTRAAVYRAVTTDGTPYFVKLRRGMFDETTVELPKFLSTQGIKQIIAPLETNDGRLRTELDEFKLILYPFVEGKNGYDVVLSDDQWAEFGATLEKIHGVALPPTLAQQIESETYSPYWREYVTQELARVEQESFDDALNAQAAVFLLSKREDVLAMIARAKELAIETQARDPQFVLCHTDLHAGNLLITPEGALYIVDWDSPTLSPRERDLMFIGGGQGFTASSEDKAEQLFYHGYTHTAVDLGALAYYRFERTIYDIGVYLEQIFSGTDEKERAQHLDYLKWNWLPNFVVERAYAADTRWKEQAAK